MQVWLENNQYMYFISFNSFDMHTIKYIWFCTVYFRPFRHEIKHKKIELKFYFLFKSHPPYHTLPPCTFFNQVLHMWYTVCLPGFTPTPAMYSLETVSLINYPPSYSHFNPCILDSSNLSPPWYVMPAGYPRAAQ